MRLLHGKISTRILYLTFTFVFISSLLSLAFLTRRSKYDGPPPPFQRPTGTNSLKGIDPLLYNSGPPSGKLWYPRERALANATLLALVRNSEADAMVQSMLDLERVFNLNFNFPWTFLNNVPFDEEFKRKTRAATKADIFYG
ncbi:glycolipid 2-alpha-mannosyltransferase-domain-containing protein [Terfezia claveryi]|nr:glycolipid 2-alpha-mannosyltransferase-domain-containing protein [Terfezia claveryi]